MSDLDEGQREQLKFLLADFGAIKAEIARRSTLQRVVLVGYLAVVALVFQQTVSASLSRLWVFAIWAIAALAYQFYVRSLAQIRHHYARYLLKSRCHKGRRRTA